MSQDRSAIIDQVCPSCKEKPPPPHRRRKYPSTSKYTKPTRKDVRDSLLALLGSGVLLGLVHIAFETKGLLFPWLSSLAWIIGILKELDVFKRDDITTKHNHWPVIILCLGAISINFAFPVIAYISVAMIYLMGGFVLLGYSFLILLTPLIKNVRNLRNIPKQRRNIGIGIGVISLFFASIMIFGWVAVRSAIGSVIGSYLMIMVVLGSMCLGLYIFMWIFPTESFPRKNAFTFLKNGRKRDRQD